MGLLDKLKSAFLGQEKLDVSARFEFSREAIAGTMSKFRCVRDLKTGKLVGLKLLDAEKTALFEARFKGLKKPSEGEIGLQIKHPRVVETYECGLTTQGQPYIVMEFVPGHLLHFLLQNRDPLLEEKGSRLELVREMAESIAAVHQAGFIHRDICPRNFIVAPEGNSLKLIDFGLTVPNQREYLLPGNRTGTPLYMAPEIVRRRPTDHRLDLFSFGVTAYRVLTWELPWPGSDTTGKAALAHDTQAPRDIFALRPKLNRLLGETVMKCISADPDDRPETAEKVLLTLRKAAGEETP